MKTHLELAAEHIPSYSAVARRTPGRLPPSGTIYMATPAQLEAFAQAVADQVAQGAIDALSGGQPAYAPAAAYLRARHALTKPDPWPIPARICMSCGQPSIHHHPGGICKRQDTPPD